MSVEQAAHFQMAYADVQDVAMAHRLAFEKPEASNERFLILNSMWVAQDWCKCLYYDSYRKDNQRLTIFSDDVFNELAVPGFTTHVGTPESGKTFKYKFIIDNSKSLTKLGMTYRTKAESAKALIEDMQARKAVAAESEES